MNEPDAEDAERRLKELAGWADHILEALRETGAPELLDAPEALDRAREEARALRRTLVSLAADLHLATRAAALTS